MNSYADSLFLSNKRMMAASGDLDRHLVLDELDAEELPCPYCYAEAFDVQSLCDHIEDEHCYETQSAACPMCHMPHVRDMVGHLTTHHTQLLFKERGRMAAAGGGRRVASHTMHSKGATSRMLEMDLGCCEDDYLERAGGIREGGRYGGYLEDGEDDAFDMPGTSASPAPPRGGKGKMAESGAGGASTSKWGGQLGAPSSPAAHGMVATSPAGYSPSPAGGARGPPSSADSKHAEERHREAESRALFAQNLLLSTLSMGGLGLGGGGRGDGGGGGKDAPSSSR